jgi:hypothetical protein
LGSAKEVPAEVRRLFRFYEPRRPDFFDVACGLTPCCGLGAGGCTFGTLASVVSGTGRFVAKSGI